MYLGVHFSVHPKGHGPRSAGGPQMLGRMRKKRPPRRLQKEHSPGAILTLAQGDRFRLPTSRTVSYKCVLF